MQDNPLELLPKIDFVPKTMDAILNEMIADYENEYFKQTGERKPLVPASPERIFLYTEAARMYAAYQLIDQGCKQNLLAYSKGPYLDNLAAMYGLERLPAQRSVSQAVFTLSAVQPEAVVIPKGSRLSTSNQVYFQTQEDVVIHAGQKSKACAIISCEPGLASAGFLPGQISILVDPVPFVSSVSNTEITQGGADRESDLELALRAYHYPRALSVAGPEEAYLYFVKSFSQAVEGVSVSSPVPGEVDIRITLQGGKLPTTPFLNSLAAYLENKRPLTDHVSLAAPEVLVYKLDFVYYIARSDQARQAEIMAAVQQAGTAYVHWQGEKIGRDITPDQLVSLSLLAGAKRLVIQSPSFQSVAHNQLCKCSSLNAVFGGIEDD